MDSKKPVNVWIKILIAVLVFIGAGLALLAGLLCFSAFDNLLPTRIAMSAKLEGAQYQVWRLILPGTFVVFSVLTGFFGKKLGWRKLALIGTFLFGLDLILLAFLQSYIALIVLSVVGGIGAALMLVSLLTLFFTYVSPHWILATTVALFFPITRFYVVLDRIPPMTNPTIDLQNVFLGMGGIVLVAGGFGLVLLLAAHLIGNAFTWPEDICDPSGGLLRKGRIIRVLVAVLLMTLALGVYRYNGLTRAEFALLQLFGRNTGLFRTLHMGPALFFTVVLAFSIGPIADILEAISYGLFHHRVMRPLTMALGVLIYSAASIAFQLVTDAQAVSIIRLLIILSAFLVLPMLVAILLSDAPSRHWGWIIGIVLGAIYLGNIILSFFTPLALADLSPWVWAGTAIFCAFVSVVLVFIPGIHKKKEQPPSQSESKIETGPLVEPADPPQA